MLFFPGLTTLFYFFLVYRATASATQGFELPGASRRSRIKELEGLIHNLDKAHHYLELGDIYFQKGNLSKAEECYRASLERDAQDIDARAHLGQCLLRQKRAGEARPILQQVCLENPNHDYGHSLMAFAETLASLGETDNAIAVWKQVLQDHTYARARVQLGELYLATKQPELATPSSGKQSATTATRPATSANATAFGFGGPSGFLRGEAHLFDQSLWTSFNLDLMACWRSHVTEPRHE